VSWRAIFFINLPVALVTLAIAFCAGAGEPLAGSATLTTEPSMNAMLEPRMVAASTHGLSRCAQPGIGGAPRMTPSSHGRRSNVVIVVPLSRYVAGAKSARAGAYSGSSSGSPV
jgi:hypothetical protein